MNILQLQQTIKDYKHYLYMLELK